MDDFKLLIVDDDQNIRKTLKVGLGTQGYAIEVASSAEEALEKLKKMEFDFVLTDVKLGGKSGIDLIRSLKTMKHPPISAVMTAYASFENAVTAIQAGAFDYLPKPFTQPQLHHLIAKVKTLVDLKRENRQLRGSGRRETFFSGMVSPAIKRLEEFVERVAPSDATVLLTGESGTGKTELARVIHEGSRRKDGPFIVMNCGTLTESILESELFGHVKGAFTGASADHVGRIEAAQNGTLFIDEVGELSPSAQTRLLRFLQERVIERVGSTHLIELNVRVIAATNKDLNEAVADHSFREDLFYRLNVFECALVPLRLRREDLPLLATRFLREFSSRAGISPAKSLSSEVEKTFQTYSWPGNIRELRNAMERAVLLSDSASPSIALADLPESITRPKPVPQKGSFQLRTLDELERDQIENVLAVEPNQERAAEILGITTVTLWRKRKQYGLP